MENMLAKALNVLKTHFRFLHHADENICFESIRIAFNLFEGNVLNFMVCSKLQSIQLIGTHF